MLTFSDVKFQCLYFGQGCTETALLACKDEKETLKVRIACFLKKKQQPKLQSLKDLLFNHLRHFKRVAH